MRKLFTILLCIVSVSALHYKSMASDTHDIPKEIQNPKLVGKGIYSYMFWDLYEASLFAPKGQFRNDRPFALRLEYLRDLSGRKIADKSIEEIRKQGFANEVRLADWHNQIQAIFPDVSNGDALTGVAMPNGQTIFYQNDREIGRVKDTEFTKRFFDIWLNEKTSAPELRMSLLGAL